MLALTQKGFSASDVLAMSEAEASAYIEILTDGLPGAPSADQKRYVSRRKPK
jgi:hypothetical protein